MHVLEISNPQFNKLINYLVKIKISEKNAVYNLIMRQFYI